jgi:uncharacterized protein (UPF0332 family)
LSAVDYLTKAEHAVASAERLFAEGDMEGAANRAYYGMFHAARAALLSAGESIAGKHGTIIGHSGCVSLRKGRSRRTSAGQSTKLSN